MKRNLLLAMLMTWTAATLLAANKKETVDQLTEGITLTTAVDYHITSATPLRANGQVNIVNTDNAVVILDQVRPSKLTASTLSTRILINGEAAVNGKNCQVRIYDRGCIILPYGDDVKPLTLYTERRQQGESCSDFGLENANGFMNDLTDAKLNNRALSFTLRRGYMVTFATQKRGQGYSRCYVADRQNLSITLPNILAGRISSYRIFKWNDVNKQGWGGSQADINAALNATWCYDWGAGNPKMADTEYVTHHHNKWWPGVDEVGRNGSSPHALGNNEPDNTNDPNEIPTTVAEVLDTWSEMMATGKRLGSPAVAGNTAWLSEFMDSIDARGWRCDFVAVHAYWYSSRWDWEWLLGEYHNNYGNGRPIWITEMNWGAGWTGWPNGNRDANAQNYQSELDGFRPILEFLAECNYIERYAPFNLWEGCYKFHNGDDASLASKQYLTPIGQYYATMNPGLAYNQANEKKTNSPKMYAPSNFRNRGGDLKKGIVRLIWNDKNGEYNNAINLQRRNNDDETPRWETIATLDIKEQPATYNYTDTVAKRGNYTYRVEAKPCTGGSLYSAELTFDITTDIEPITSNERKNGSDDIYTLNGYKTSRPRPQVLNHKQKGVYIVNKKKVIL